MVSAILGIIILVIVLVIAANISIDPPDIGKAGESEVSFVLHSLPEEYLVINNVIIPDQGSGPNR